MWQWKGHLLAQQRSLNHKSYQQNYHSTMKMWSKISVLWLQHWPQPQPLGHSEVPHGYGLILMHAHTHTQSQFTVRLMSKHYNCVELLRHEVREEFSASKAQYRAVGGREGGADVLSSHISVISIPCSAPQAQIRVLEINCWDCWLLIFFFCDVFYTTTKRLMFVWLLWWYLYHQ